MRPLYVFDLDGTLALIDHRRPILRDESLAPNDRWRKFFAACVDDVPNTPVIRTLQALRQTCDVEIWSARSSEVELETLRWLNEYVGVDIRLRMRRSGDHMPDVELKMSWLDRMPEHDRNRLVAFFDDRNSVVAAYRARGYVVFQVAPGDF